LQNIFQKWIDESCDSTAPLVEEGAAPLHLIEVPESPLVAFTNPIEGPSRFIIARVGFASAFVSDKKRP